MIIKKVCSIKKLLVIFFSIVGYSVFAQDFYVYGSTSLYGQGYIDNNDYLLETNSKDFNTYIQQDLLVTFEIENMAKSITEVNLKGTLDTVGDVIAPLYFDINQLFVQVPFGDNLFFYTGKRVKEIGFSEIFPIVNRVNPKYYSDSEVTTLGAGVLELNWFPTYWMNYTLMAYFNDIEDEPEWDEIDYLGQIDIFYDMISCSALLYWEYMENLAIGAAASIQVEYFNFYTEYMYSLNSSNQLVGNDELVFRDTNHFHSINIGTKFQKDSLSITLEYFYNDDGYNLEEAEGLMNFLVEQDNIDMGTSLLDQNRFMKHHLGLYIGYTPYALSNLNIGLSALFSLSEMDKYDESSGMKIEPNIIYNLTQSIQLGVMSTIYSGYTDNIYNSYKEFSSQHMLFLKMTY